MDLGIFPLIWVVAGALCAVIANAKNRPALAWGMFGLLCSPVILVLICLPSVPATPAKIKQCS